MALQTDKKRAKVFRNFPINLQKTQQYINKKLQCYQGLPSNPKQHWTEEHACSCLEKSCHTLSVSADASTAPESEVADVSQLSDDATVFMFDVL